MIIECTVCGNKAVSDKSGVYSCKVCGSAALWEEYPPFETIDKQIRCPECGNPLKVKGGESLKCAVCGFEGAAQTEKTGENTRASRSASQNASVMTAGDKKEMQKNSANILNLEISGERDDSQFRKPDKAAPEINRAVSEQINGQDEESISPDMRSLKSGHGNADALNANSPLNESVACSERSLEHDKAQNLGEDNVLKKKEQTSKITIIGKEISAEVKESKRGVNSGRVNAQSVKPIVEDKKRLTEAISNRDSNNIYIAKATNISAVSEYGHAQFTETGFEKIYIEPAPLNKTRTPDPDVSFVIKGKFDKEIKLVAPVLNYSDNNIAVFNAVPYYLNGKPLRDDYEAFKALNSTAFNGVSILPYNLEEDLILADDLNCGFVEIVYDYMLPPGTEKTDAAKAITAARGIISRRSLGLYLIVKLSAFTSADLIKALCLGADALSAVIPGIPDDLITELKEYCVLCAHGKITEFSRSDLKFK